MNRTEQIKVAAGGAQQLPTSGMSFKLRNMVGGAAPFLVMIVEDASGKGRLAENLKGSWGDPFNFGEPFRKIVFLNTTGSDITADVLVSDEPLEADISFPAIAGSALAASADVMIPHGSVLTLVSAANLNLRSITIASRDDNDPTAIPLRVGDQAGIAAPVGTHGGAGAQLGYGGEHTFDCSGAIYALNPDAALDQWVTILGLRN